MKTLGAIKSLLSLKVVLMGVMVMAVAGGLIGGGLFAYFSDTETSTGNTFTAGTIDIGVDGENPWQESFHMEVKPCEMGSVEFEIQNVGTNPVDVWKHIWVTDVTGGIEAYQCGVYPFYPYEGDPLWLSSEPECEAEGAYWTVYPVPNPYYPYFPEDEEECEVLGGIYQDPDEEPGTGDETCALWDTTEWYPYDFLFWDTLYDIDAGQCYIGEEDWYYLSEIAGYDLGEYEWNEGYWLYLGQIQPEDSMEVWQSYHLIEWYWYQNQYQGDTIYFDIELYAQQTTGNVEPPYPQWDSYNCPAKYDVY